MSFSVATDPRVERVALPQLLANAQDRFSYFFRRDIPYVREAERRFGPFRDHPAVRMFEKLSEMGLLDYNLLNELALSCGGGMTLKSDPPSHLAAAFGGGRGVESFLKALRDLCRRGNFEQFWEKTRRERSGWVRQVEGQIEKLDLEGRFERYARVGVPADFEIALSPFASRSDVKTSVDRTRRRPAITMINGPKTASGGRLRFDFRPRSGDVWRQWADLALEPAFAKSRQALARSGSLYDSMRPRWGGDWESCARLITSFGVGSRMLRRLPNTTADIWARKYRNIGILHIGVVTRALAVYERHPTRYGSLPGFLPHILAAFERECGVRSAPFDGGLGELFAEKGPLSVVLAPGNVSRLGEELRSVWPQAEVMDPKAARSTDLSGRTVAVFGSLEEKGLVDSVRAALPVKFAKGKVSVFRRRRLLRTYRGESLRVASVAPHPSDLTKGMGLFLASRPRELAGLLGRVVPGADFILLEGEARLKTGRYDRTMDWDVQ